MTIDCEHDPDRIVEERGAFICTTCGTVLDESAFLPQIQYAAEDHPDALESGSGAKRRGRSRNLDRVTMLNARVEADTVDPETRLKNRKIYASRSVVKDVCRSMRIDETTLKLAEEIHVEFLRVRDVRGDDRLRSTAAAAVYFACMSRNCARSETEFAANVHGLTRTELTKANRWLRRSFEGTGFSKYTTGRVDPSHLIPRFVDRLCSELEVPGNRTWPLKRTTEDVIRTHRDYFTGRSPECVTAAAFIVALTADTLAPAARYIGPVSKVTGVSKASLKNIVTALTTI